jgi:apolipoprotein N-acyltransferase
MGCALLVIRRVRNGALVCAALSSSVLLGDITREWLLPSFPWVSVAYTQVDGIFSALFPLIGATGLGWAVLFTESTLSLMAVDLIRHRAFSRVNVLSVGVLSLCTASAWWIAPTLTRAAAPLHVAVMQTALPTREKFSKHLLLSHLDEIVHFAQAHEAQLIITPETAVPTILETSRSTSTARLTESATTTRALILGTFAQDSRGGVYNSAVLLQRDPRVSGGVRQTTYIKQHLAPVGEYSPRALRWLVDLLDLQVPQLEVTQDSHAMFHVSGITVVPSICQDLLYGNDLRVLDDGPHLMVNLSNFSFFSSSLARAQFINIARTRALEQQIPVIISSNLGPSVFVEANGEVAERLPPNAAGALESTIHSRRGMTPYGRTGDLFSYLVICITTSAGLLYAWRQRTPGLVTQRRPGSFWTVAVIATFAGLALAMASQQAVADPLPSKDISYGHDHPMISRFTGSVLVEYEQRDYDELVLPVGPYSPATAAFTKSSRAEGKVTRLVYILGGGKTSLEVLRNYKQSLTAAGFTIEFECAGQEGCGGLEFTRAVAAHMLNGGFKTQVLIVGTLLSINDSHHLTASLKQAAGEVAVGVTVVHNQGRPVGILLQIAEPKTMQTGAVLVDANAIAKALQAQGRVALYGIHFDTDSTELKTDSAPTIREIVSYLVAHPAVKVFVVGHTDNAGSLAHNLDLSQRRAEAVVSALTTGQKIAASRLSAKGLASYAPVASNETDAGRGQNRRVELVLQ